MRGKRVAVVTLAAIFSVLISFVQSGTLHVDTLVRANAPIASTVGSSFRAIPKHHIAPAMVTSSSTMSMIRQGSADDGRGVYVALGDSYSAGEGVRPYIQGTDAIRSYDSCHRSTRAYPTIIAKRFPLMDFRFVACSGAITDNVGWLDGNAISKQAKRQYDGEHIQLQTLRDVAPHVQLVTISIGGNDSGFVDTLSDCAQQPHCENHPPSSWANKIPGHEQVYSAFVEQDANYVRPRVRRVLQSIRTIVPTAQVVVVGYPHLFPSTPAEQHCDLLDPPQWFHYYHFELDEQNFMNHAVDVMDALLEKEAATIGATFVSPVAAFLHHEPCGSKGRWLSSIVFPGRDKTNMFPEGAGSFHPTVTGQQHYAELVSSHIYTPRAQVYEATVLGDQPFAYWSLSETKGTTAFDLAANGQSGGTPEAGIRGYRDGKYEGNMRLGAMSSMLPGSTAPTFDGNSCTGIRLDEHASDLKPRADFSVEAWVKPLDPAAHATVFRYFPDGWELALDNGGPLLKGRADNSVPFEVAAPGTMRSGSAWYHIVAVKNARLVTLYVNGVMVGSGSAGLTLSYDQHAQGQVSIGRSAHECNGSGAGVKGGVSQVALYMKPLDAGTIAAHYRANSLMSVGSPVVPYMGGGYKYRVVASGRDKAFVQPNFDDARWATGTAAFGTPGAGCSLYDQTVRTPWPLNTDILIRKHFSLTTGATNVRVSVAVDNGVQVFLNGHDISGGLRLHDFCATRDAFTFSAPDAVLKAGDNVLAVRGHDRGVADYLDVQVTASTFR